jgi:hypothetical protein
MTFNVCLTTITGTGQQSWIAFGFPAMVDEGPPDPVYRFPRTNGDSYNFCSRQAFPAKKPVKIVKKPYPQAPHAGNNCFPYLGSPRAMTRAVLSNARISAICGLY